MITIRRSNERGGGDHGWLKTRHTFSFSDYWDDKWMGFRSLRVINEDFVGPSAGFPAHPHRDMEIITYILSGELEHKDSLGTGSVIRPGDGQRMTAGRGIRHSEHNPSATETAHLLQIWITPSKQGLEPSYEQKSFPESEKRGKLRLIASNDGADGSVKINQDVKYPNLFYIKGGTETMTGAGVITTTNTAYRIYPASFSNPTLTFTLSGTTNLVRVGATYTIDKKGAGNLLFN